MAVIKGLDVIIKVGNLIVGGQRNASLEMTSETIDTTCKSSGGWAEKVAGLKSWTSSCDGIYFVNDEGLAAAKTAFNNGGAVEVIFSSADITYRGNAVITSMSLEASQEDVVAYTISMEGTGQLLDTLPTV